MRKNTRCKILHIILACYYFMKSSTNLAVQSFDSYRSGWFSHLMKNIIVFIAGNLLLQYAFSMQNHSDNESVNFSELRTEIPASAKISDSAHQIRIKIDVDDVSYKEFAYLLQQLGKNGFFNIILSYKDRLLDISSNGMEWKIPVCLPGSFEKNKTRFPFLKEINTEGEKFIILYWKINNPGMREESARDVEQFHRYISSLPTNDIGFSFVIDSKVSVKILLEYILAIPDHVNIKGFLFNNPSD